MSQVVTAAPPCALAGGFGVVTLCADDASRVRKTVEHSVATHEQVRHEYALMCLLDHTNIVRAHALEHDAARTAIVMDHAGVDLFHGRVPLARARGVFVQILAGVAHMHARGIAHRDLKMENVLLDGAGRVRIADFGLAIQVRSDRVGERVCTVACGSELYAAPEIWRGAYDPFPVDVWSIAVMLYALHLDAAPFRSTRPGATEERVFARWRVLVDTGTLAPAAALEEVYGRPGVAAPWARAVLDATLLPAPGRRLTLFTTDAACALLLAFPPAAP